MRIAVEVLVPLWLFVYRFLSERRRSLLLALAVVAHLNLKFFKKIQIGGTHYSFRLPAFFALKQLNHQSA